MPQIPRADEGRNCPFNGQDMSTVCHACPMWIKLRGANPNTGEEIDRWDCSFALLPLLLIENSQQTRQAGAAIESLRNETVRTTEQACRVIAATATAAQRAAPSVPLLEDAG